MPFTARSGSLPDDSLFHEQIADRIKQLQAFEQEMPAFFVVHNLSTDLVVYLSKRGQKCLGLAPDEINLPYTEYHNRFFNPDNTPYYAPRVLGLLERNNPDEVITFFQQVRRSPAEEWNWHLSSMRIFMQDGKGQPLLTLTMTLPFDPTHPIAAKVERLWRENEFLRKNQHIFAALTKREKEILRLMAVGMNSKEIAGQMHISEATAATHRRNIRSKLNAPTNYDITRFAQAFDLI